MLQENRKGLCRMWKKLCKSYHLYRVNNSFDTKILTYYIFGYQCSIKWEKNMSTGKIKLAENELIDVTSCDLAIDKAFF